MSMTNIALFNVHKNIMNTRFLDLHSCFVRKVASVSFSKGINPDLVVKAIAPLKAE